MRNPESKSKRFMVHGNRYTLHKIGVPKEIIYRQQGRSNIQKYNKQYFLKLVEGSGDLKKNYEY